MMTKNYGARLTFRTTERVNQELERYAKITCRTKNSIINEAVHLYVAERILHCELDEIFQSEDNT
ncbi:MAG: hypothetical protein IJ955_03380 [Oscillospiraceae bacterium]|nr:hypothetical protein [Oscillospiraceae bacterium]